MVHLEYSPLVEYVRSGDTPDTPKKASPLSPQEPAMQPTRPPLYHLAMSVLRRSQGRSAVAASAYRSGSRMVDLRTGLVADYSRKQDVAPLALILPGGCPPADRATFWNAVEAHHRRREAVTARELDAALPRGLSRNQETSLAERFAHWLADAFHVGVDVGIHRKAGNHHLDVLLSACEVKPDGSLGKKVCALDGIANQRNKSALNPVEIIREMWARMTNEALAEAGRQERVDHRSYARQGVALKPGFHLGRAAHAMEVQQPGSTDIGARLAEIMQENEQAHPENRRSHEPEPNRPERKPRARRPRVNRPGEPLADPGVPRVSDAAALPGGPVGPGRGLRRPAFRR